MNGTEGDLLTGLPTQMTEIHEPIRVLMLVEQTPEVALQAIWRASSRQCFAFPSGWPATLWPKTATILVVWTRSLSYSLGAASLISLSLHSLHQAYPFVVGILASYALGVIGNMGLPRSVRNQPLDRCLAWPNSILARPARSSSPS